MATWRSPGTAPVHIALLSGHAVVIGPEGRELLPMFESAALAVGCIREQIPALTRKRRASTNNTAEASDEPPEPSDANLT